MTRRQLDLCPNFSAREIQRAGGKLAGIDFASFMVLQAWRTAIGQPVKFQKNGINSGDHDSEEHPDGKAFDVYTVRRITFRTVRRLVYLALKCGFRGIGIYHNGTMYSFHLDTGENRGWVARKKRRGRRWSYYPMIVDPKSA